MRTLVLLQTQDQEALEIQEKIMREYSKMLQMKNLKGQSKVMHYQIKAGSKNPNKIIMKMILRWTLIRLSYSHTWPILKMTVSLKLGWFKKMKLAMIRWNNLHNKNIYKWNNKLKLYKIILKHFYKLKHNY